METYELVAMAAGTEALPENAAASVVHVERVLRRAGFAYNRERQDRANYEFLLASFLEWAYRLAPSVVPRLDDTDPVIVCCAFGEHALSAPITDVRGAAYAALIEMRTHVLLKNLGDAEHVLSVRELARECGARACSWHWDHVHGTKGE